KGLKEKEEFILTAEERMNKLEYQIYNEVLEQVLSYTTEIQSVATNVAKLDCILSFAYTAQKHQYCKPVFTDKAVIKIAAGRHPVVENIIEELAFVPNNVLLNHQSHQLMIITGPNMAGKSVFIRQVALIVLLAQIGSYVPAQKTILRVVDRIFVRSGASDVITAGLSTFMVEMVETAQILNTCTENSLIIMDEIGRGTSTYDGISIAWAVAEHLAKHSSVGPLTLFATHYHELQKLADTFPEKIVNYHMAVERQQEEPIFLHTLLPGGASHSYGVDVAKLAGVPKEVTDNAWIILKELERGNHAIEPNEKDSSKKIIQENYRNVITTLKKIDIDNLTPLQALQTLVELQQKCVE
ncbi:MAG: DNA mismatch repair protein MutS, partial [Patescibacteria group bacterium]